MIKKGFTYLELVIVIVLIGILALLSLERLKKDNLYEAANQIVSHIQYTQHLSMIDDQFDPKNENWITQQYRIQFHNKNNNHSYSIYRDLDNNNDLSKEDAILKDPVTNKLICGRAAICETNRLEAVDIKSKYGVSVEVKNAGGARHILFDYLGRPMLFDGSYPNPAKDIQVVLTANDEEQVIINIASETGFITLL